MHFDLSEEHTLIQRTAREYATRRLMPNAAERDQKSIFPDKEMVELAELGLLGIAVPEDLGGADAGIVAYSLVMQELARGDASVAVNVSVSNMVAELVCKVGTEDQKRAHVPKITNGDYVAASFALSEPQAGSDPAGLSTRAERSKRGWKPHRHQAVGDLWRQGRAPGRVGGHRPQTLAIAASRRSWSRVTPTACR